MAKSSAPELPSDEMDAHIEELMGPVPEKASTSVSAKSPAKKSASIYPDPAKDPNETTNEGSASVKSAAEAANEALKSMDPALGEAEISKVDDGVEALPNLVSEDAPEKIEVKVNSAAKAEADSTESPIAESVMDEIAEDEESDETAEEETAESSIPDLDDPLTDEAVDDIIAEEGDKILEAEDAKKAEEEPIIPIKSRGSFRKKLAKLWSNPTARWSILGGLTAVILVLGLVPSTRYFALNTAGVRSSLSLTVLDNETDQPLKNVKISAAGVSGQTDSKGFIKLKGVRLGKTKLLIEKRAFANYSKEIVIGWGSNPLGKFEVKAVGTQYIFNATDFLSGKAVSIAEASSGDGNAHADKEGKLVLTLDTSGKDDTDQITVTITAKDYRSETINLTVNNREVQSVKMVPSRKHVFISKRSGKYDVYTIDVDGRNERKIVSGTGLERDDISLIPHQNDSIAALVSTRENVRDQNGYLLSTLYLLNTSTGDLVKIDQSEQMQIVGWSSDEHLVYVKIAAGSSGANPKRHRLVSFNARDVSDIKELAASNSFNDVLMMGDRVYFAPSNIFQDNPNASLYAVDPDGGNQKNILSKEVFNIFRTGYDSLILSAANNSWYNYRIGNTAATSTQAPSNPANRLYTDSQDGTDSLWVDQRDGKGVLLDYNKAKKTDLSLESRPGLKTPAYWLSNNYVVFRVNDGRETADYVINMDGGESRKITNVTDTSGIDRWYYY